MDHLLLQQYLEASENPGAVRELLHGHLPILQLGVHAIEELVHLVHDLLHVIGIPADHVQDRGHAVFLSHNKTSETILAQSK
jgi:hypothetical protein